ncbi:MAG TPA: glycosyl hydrolase [Sedimentisphaerales bacterium]|nr:glycosyl hydrolase [Sedimentisphaerales bacterium]
MKRSIICWAALLTLGVALGAGSGSNTTLKLTDPLATPETKALYRNLHKVAQEGILFGHEDTLAYGVGWKSTENDFDSDVHRVCGKFPAVFGWDLGHIGTDANIDGVPFEYMKVWIAKGYEKGGINTISWHARIPGTKQSSWTQKKVVSSLLPDGDMHKAYLVKLDQIAAFLADLKGPGGEPVPIIFRPFHEHNGDWFWWGAKWCTPDEYKQIWRFTVDYLRKTKGLHNIITAYSPDRFKDREEYLERYPGDDYIDIIGHDNYGDFRSIKTKDQAVQALEIVVSLAEERNKIAAFTETGVGQRAANATWWTDVLLEVLKSSPSTKKIAWVLVWRNADKRQNYAAFSGAATVENFKAFEADTLTLFMEDLPQMYK